jgi:hypothetical protein
MALAARLIVSTASANRPERRPASMTARYARGRRSPSAAKASSSDRPLRILSEMRPDNRRPPPLLSPNCKGSPPRASAASSSFKATNSSRRAVSVRARSAELMQRTPRSNDRSCQADNPHRRQPTSSRTSPRRQSAHGISRSVSFGRTQPRRQSSFPLRRSRVDRRASSSYHLSGGDEHASVRIRRSHLVGPHVQGSHWEIRNAKS